MNQVQIHKGMTVKLHYTGWRENGEIFDSSREREPVEMTIGGGKILTGFERRIMGMRAGEKRTFTIPPSEGFGERRDDLMVRVKRSDFPDDFVPILGQQLQLLRPDGTAIDVVVVALYNGSVTLDANHPLAGETLFFEVELLEIV